MHVGAEIQTIGVDSNSASSYVSNIPLRAVSVSVTKALKRLLFLVSENNLFSRELVPNRAS